ncbi:MAG TPA: hypothetical protein VMF30_11585 [Pirellulales bacterium]|nr:hypothetical protein [Pirellulales bacterium]
MNKFRITPFSSQLRKTFLLLVPLLLQSGCNMFAGIQPSQETAERFLTELRAGDKAAAYGRCSTSCRAAASQEDIEGIWNAIVEGRGKVESWRCEGSNATVSTAGSSVTLTYRLNCEHGECLMRFIVVPEGDQWLLQGVNYQHGPRRNTTEKGPADGARPAEKTEI